MSTRTKHIRHAATAFCMLALSPLLMPAALAEPAEIEDGTYTCKLFVQYETSIIGDLDVYVEEYGHTGYRVLDYNRVSRRRDARPPRTTLEITISDNGQTLSYDGIDARLVEEHMRHFGNTSVFTGRRERKVVTYTVASHGGAEASPYDFTLNMATADFLLTSMATMMCYL